MSFGIDCIASPPIADLKAAGVTFVCRYLSEVNSQTAVKLLTPTEAKALSQGGIAIVSNFEWYANRALGGTYAGAQDAQVAASQHVNCGGPSTRPIYFSVDFDSDGTPVADYFRGVASVIGIARTGAYGSFRVLKYLFDNHLITWGWQTYAWSGGQWEPRAHLQQYSNGVMLAGHDVDYDRSIKSDFGQWFSGGHMPIPTGWHDANGVLTATNNIPVTMGFRQHIIDAASWDAANVPQEAEYHAEQVLLHNASVGSGQRQLFRDDMLWFTSAKGVIQEPYLGLELDAAYKLIAAQQAEIATLKAAPPAPTPMPNILDALSHVEAALAAAGVVSTELGKAVPDLKQ